MNRKAVVIMTIFTCIAMTLTGCNDDDGGKAPTVDVTGIWEGQVSGGNEIMLDLVQIDGKVTGAAYGGGESGQVSGTVEESKFRFKIEWRVSGLTTSAEAYVDGDRMTGTGTEDGYTGTFSATR
ncbi:hypothetical protein PDESU_04274 [Pontiella desulfatans]|uniref:Lipocalin-like domain-containing protein n=1 Tax=Pontiella desulfatans TaxID=2750659 RepID=A0A6C2U764_PONDE|nr:hypothetical protein [Pontiella desulfatans]VGO15689.1 hypothetical protein PDESU_04274 [Pontiella desulfatans]